MSVIVDARGLSCPQPVLLTVNEIKKVVKGEIVVLVDTDIQGECFPHSSFAGVDAKGVEPDGTGYRISIAKD